MATQTKATLLSKADAGYVEQSPELDEGVSCATCRWFTPSEGDAPGMCNVVDGEISPDGYSEWYTPMDDAPEDETDDEIIEETPEGDVEIEEMATDERARKWRLSNPLARFNKNNATMRLTPHHSYFKALGRGYWLAVFTNDFKDLEDEILKSTAHDRYVARVEKKLTPPPELWLWHTPGTRIGVAETVGREGHFTWAFGTFDQTAAGKAAEKRFLKSRDVFELSHGFTYPTWAKDDAGVYHEFNTFEISVLPKGMAANQYTRFSLQEIIDMPVSEAQREFFRERLGSEAADVLKRIDALGQEGKNLEAQGAAFKDFGDTTKHDHSSAAKGADETVSAMKGFAEALTEGMSELLDTIERIEKEHAEDRKALLAARKDYEEITAELRSVRNRAPRQVDQSKSNVVTDEAEAGKAKEEILLKQLGDDIWENKALGLVKKEYAHLLPHIQKSLEINTNGAK